MSENILKNPSSKNGKFTTKDVRKILPKEEKKKKFFASQIAEDLAKASGLDRTYISSVEQGKQNMTFSAILRISEALGVEVVDLMKSSRNIIDL